MSDQVKRVLIADDHPLILDGIKSLLDDTPYQICTEARSIVQVVDKLYEFQPDILILDLNMSGTNTVDHIEKFKRVCVGLKILVFSSYNTSSLVKAAFLNGADGYVLKDSSRAELIEALDALSDNDTYIGKTVNYALNGPHSHKIDESFKDVFSKKANLSDRELEVIQLIIYGANNREIAEKLFISKHTVQSHRRNILNKLSMHSGAEIIKFAYKTGLVPIA